MTQRCARARSLLFVPGNRPERFQKAARSGADAVILDLEDAVPAADKTSARAAIGREWALLQDCDVPWVVRINPSDTAAGEDDLAWLKGLSPAPAAVMVPKAESPQALAGVHARLDGIATLPIVESAAGYAALPSLAAAAGVLRLAIGHIDFMADTGIQCDDLETELAPLRFAVAIATRLNRLAPAIDGVTVQIDDELRLRADARRALRYGFGGKLCIHPRQVAVLHEALVPTGQELEWARRVIAADAAAEGAAVQLDGRMVDLPVVLQAHRTMARAATSSAKS
ncbi:CoA ester lyase [Variovorax sp. dw_308]|uniref:HpcH/HpaI aldolase/citrate lyase family protein n=1 Tax=Variovorax sp. dw_308 TaxID=2721546 RepID=UPI00210C0863|nr:CoA ester lyase [Variovorax sp. dw_308]